MLPITANLRLRSAKLLVIRSVRYSGCRMAIDVLGIKNFEYEERAFLEEKDFVSIKTKLDSLAKQVTLDNKKSYFFVLSDVNISIATSAKKTVIKYKGGQLGKGNGFEEYEVAINPGSCESAIAFVRALLKIDPMVSEQFRLNYDLGNGIEVALKYTKTWGFHLEVEKVYSLDSKNNDAVELAKTQAQKELNDIAHKLGISYMTTEDIDIFVAKCKTGYERGSYTSAEFTKKYDTIFS